MKPKTKEFIDLVVSNPKLSRTEAYIRTHETTHRPTARANASELMSKPNVLAYLETKSDIAEKTLYQVLKTSKKHSESVNWQRLAKDTANDVLDRVHGKPLARTTNTNLNINLEQAINELE